MKKFKNLSKRALALVVSVMMCMGILQVNALAAVTVEAKVICELEEHTHAGGCYPLICGLEETEAVEAHTHSDACYGEPELTCGLEETEAVEGHTHGEDCYDESGTLICVLEETEAVEGHTHSDACYGEPELICGLEETEAVESHTHTDTCRDLTADPICGKTEHTHDKNCYSADNVYEVLYEKLTNGDEDVVLILNGTDLYMNKYTGGTISVNGGKTLTIQDSRDGEEVKVAGGTIWGNGTQHVITVVNGGKLTLSGETVITGGAGGVQIQGTGSEFTMNGGKITGNTNNATNGGGVTLKDYDWKNTPIGGGTFTMNGGEISNNTTSGNGGGVYVSGGTFTMNDGTISGNTATWDDGDDGWVGEGSWNVHPDGQGGGVYVTGENGKFTMSGGTISSNTAGEGGGIFIDEKSNFTMDGGTVGGGDPEADGKGTTAGNTAMLGEGGGIYIQGTGTITKGNIIGNKTFTTKDLGGGGIYIESNTGKLNLKNAIITDNLAEGLGGGLAACVHGQTVVYVTNGALIYKNDNKGETDSKGHWVPDGDGGLVNNGDTIDGSDLWEETPAFMAAAKDIFTASDGGNGAKGGVIVSNKVLGDGKAGWTGYLFAYDEKGELVKNENGVPQFVLVEADSDGNVMVNKELMAAIQSDRLLALTANPDKATIEAAEKAAAAAGGGVIIKGNYSATHGGGIANNGLLVIGEGPIEETLDKNLKLKKDYTNSVDNSSIPLQGNDFSFTVTPKSAPENVKVEDLPVLTRKNNADGGVSFEFPEGTFTEPGEYTFSVKEVKGEKDGVTYDTTEYIVKIKVEPEKEDRVFIGSEEVIIRTITVGDPEIYKVVGTNEKGELVTEPVYKQAVDENGKPLFKDDGTPIYETKKVPALDENGNQLFDEVLVFGSITFNNTYTPPKTSDDPLVSLTITKAVVGGGDAVADKEYSFTVTSSDVAGFEEQHFTLKAGGSATIRDLKKGTYTVTEDDASVEGYTWTVSGTGVVDMTNGGDATVTVTNTYTEEEPEKGSLTITKAVVGGGDAVADKEYTFTVTSDVEGFEEQSFALKAGETKTISELDAGMYTVTEDDASVEGYTWTVSGVGGVEVIAGGSADVTVTNTYTELEPEKGSLTITKTVVGGGAAAANKEYTFTVAGPDGYSEAVSIVGSGSAALTGLEPGAYTVTEDSAEISGYTWTVSGAGEVTVTAGASANVTVTNTYSEIPEEPTPEIPNTPEEPTPTPTPEPPTPEPEIPVVPEVEVPDEPTPLEDLPELPVVSDDTIVETPEEPVVDLDDTPVPLSEPLVTEPEPEAEILEELPEDPVPLSDIPATGDISLLWYLTVAFSAAGLLILKVLGKKHEEEQA